MIASFEACLPACLRSQPPRPYPLSKAPAYYGFGSELPSVVASFMFIMLVVTCFPQAIVAQTTTSPPCAAGKYLLNASCSTCPAGSMCPFTGLTNFTKCSVGTYQPSTGATDCLPCPPGSMCPTTGGKNITMCRIGFTSLESSANCSICTPDYYSSSGGTNCSLRTLCNSSQYEISNPASSDRTCKKLNPCHTVRTTNLQYCVNSANPVLLCMGVRIQYILQYKTARSDWVCYTWAKCTSNQYLARSLVADSLGYLVRTQLCREYTTQIVSVSSEYYVLVNGSLTEDQVGGLFVACCLVCSKLCEIPNTPIATPGQRIRKAHCLRVGRVRICAAIISDRRPPVRQADRVQFRRRVHTVASKIRHW